MKISTKGRYALRMLTDLAEHREEGFISLKDIANRQGISKKYLEQIIPVLNRADILITNRGSRGGYKLADSPSKYTVGMILKLTEGGIAPVSCLEAKAEECKRRSECPTLFIWTGLRDVISDYLESITIQDILDKKQSSYSNDYVI